MKRTTSLAAAALVCVFAAAGQAQLLKRTTTKTDSIPLGAGSTLSIAGAPVGSIKVSSTTRDTVEITATIEVQAANETDLAGAALMTGFVTDESLGRVSIISVGADTRRKMTPTEKKLVKRLNGMLYRIDYVISVPKYCNVEIDAGKGEIEIAGPQGNHRLNALEANAKVDLSGGNFTSVIAKGKLAITIPSSGWRGVGIDAQVATGDISVMLPVKLSADLDATILRSGEIVNTFATLKPRDRKVPFSDKLIRAKAGAGGISIKLSVGDGRLYLQPLVE
jgi:hypothetical protein